MVHSGTLVTYGTAKAAMVATGAGTELGRLSEMLGQASEIETPLTRQLAIIARWIALAIVIISVILLGVGLLRGYALAMPCSRPRPWRWRPFRNAGITPAPSSAARRGSLSAR